MNNSPRGGPDSNKTRANLAKEDLPRKAWLRAKVPEERKRLKKVTTPKSQGGGRALNEKKREERLYEGAVHY